MGGNTALELAARYPDFPAAIVMLDSAIVPPTALAEMLKQAGESLRGPKFHQVSRDLVEGVTLQTDEPERKERIKEVMSSAPQYVMSSSFDGHLLLWDGVAAAAACKVPAFYVAAAQPLADLSRFRKLCPQIVIGQTVGAGHFNNKRCRLK